MKATEEPQLDKIELTALTYMTVNQFCKTFPAMKIGGVRAAIFNAETNDLAKSGAVVRMGRKILIKPSIWFNWIESKNGGAK
jgi:hypothetical protein